jgi:hypothetical protein
VAGVRGHPAPGAGVAVAAVVVGAVAVSGAEILGLTWG